MILGVFLGRVPLELSAETKSIDPHLCDWCSGSAFQNPASVSLKISDCKDYRPRMSCCRSPEKLIGCQRKIFDFRLVYCLTTRLSKATRVQRLLNSTHGISARILRLVVNCNRLDRLAPWQCGLNPCKLGTAGPRKRQER